MSQSVIRQTETGHETKHEPVASALHTGVFFWSKGSLLPMNHMHGHLGCLASSSPLQPDMNNGYCSICNFNRNGHHTPTRPLAHTPTAHSSPCPLKRKRAGLGNKLAPQLKAALNTGLQWHCLWFVFAPVLSNSVHYRGVQKATCGQLFIAAHRAFKIISPKVK